MLVHDKAYIRKETIKLRDHQSQMERRERSQLLTQRLFGIECVRRATEILLYADFGSEVMTGQMFRNAIDLGKKVYYPKVEGEAIAYYRVENLDELNVGYRGIQEPFMPKAAAKGNFLSDSVIIVPGSAFSREGYRVGYGKGFYDRYLASHPELNRIGVCYDVQLLWQCPHDEYDVKMDRIVTEFEELYFERE
ncbi:MAG: 5-formyltetrahydrofolate cyclo-ligase [Lachnospiraceae bacterium]|nr:5-formyltetrahydrofolate cyclo-ligase [Lachnospiraceae bacterium]